MPFSRRGILGLIAGAVVGPSAVLAAVRTEGDGGNWPSLMGGGDLLPSNNISDFAVIIPPGHGGHTHHYEMPPRPAGYVEPDASRPAIFHRPWEWTYLDTPEGQNEMLRWSGVK